MDDFEISLDFSRVGITQQAGNRFVQRSLYSATEYKYTRITCCVCKKLAFVSRKRFSRA